MPSTPEPRVTLIGKPGCHLCEAARAVVEEVTAELGESFTEISVLDRPDLIAPDDLHPDEEGLALIAQRIDELLSE